MRTENYLNLSQHFKSPKSKEVDFFRKKDYHQDIIIEHLKDQFFLMKKFGFIHVGESHLLEYIMCHHSNHIDDIKNWIIENRE